MRERVNQNIVLFLCGGPKINLDRPSGKDRSWYYFEKTNSRSQLFKGDSENISSLFIQCCPIPLALLYSVQYYTYYLVRMPFGKTSLLYILKCYCRQTNELICTIRLYNTSFTKLYIIQISQLKITVKNMSWKWRKIFIQTQPADHSSCI
jgi:hypothetical protein